MRARARVILLRRRRHLGPRWGLFSTLTKGAPQSVPWRPLRSGFRLLADFRGARRVTRALAIEATIECWRCSTSDRSRQHLGLPGFCWPRLGQRQRCRGRRSTFRAASAPAQLRPAWCCCYARQSESLPVKGIQTRVLQMGAAQRCGALPTGYWPSIEMSTSCWPSQNK